MPLAWRWGIGYPSSGWRLRSFPKSFQSMFVNEAEEIMISQFRLRIMGIIVGITVVMSVLLVACGSPSPTLSTPLRLSPSPTPTPAPPKADDTGLRLKGE